jgi:ankyrin repeat protein
MPATEEQKAALFNAAEEGDLEQFQTAAAAIDGTDIKQLHAANGANCLHIAAHAGQTELCNYLLDTLSFDINSQDEGGASRGSVAARRQCRLQPPPPLSDPCPSAPRIQHPALLPPSPAGKGSTPLVLAVAGKHWATADALLERSPDVNRQGGSGGAAAPLHLAVAEGRAELVQRLLEAGALPNAPSGSGTPLMLAAARANAAVVDLLLRHGADPREAAPNGLTPLFMAITLGGDAEVVRRLVAAGADVNARALGAFTPLHVAAEGGKAEVARLLLEVRRARLAQQGGGPCRADCMPRTGSLGKDGWLEAHAWAGAHPG